jgi:glutamate mutase epsilon subunit
MTQCGIFRVLFRKGMNSVRVEVRPAAAELGKVLPLRDYAEEIRQAKDTLLKMGINEIKPLLNRENDKSV